MGWYQVGYKRRYNQVYCVEGKRVDIKVSLRWWSSQLIKSVNNKEIVTQENNFTLKLLCLTSSQITSAST